MSSAKIYAHGNFEVWVGELPFGEMKGMNGYMIINTRHNVIESITNTEATARQLAHTFENQLQESLQNPGPIPQPQSLQELLDELTGDEDDDYIPGETPTN